MIAGFGAVFGGQKAGVQQSRSRSGAVDLEQSTGQASVSELASFHRPNTVFGLSACSVFLSRSSLFGLRSALAFLTSLVFIYQRIPVLESHVASRAESVRGAGSASSQPPRFVARCDRLIPKNSPNMGSLRSRVFLIYVVAPATVLLMLLGKFYEFAFNYKHRRRVLGASERRLLLQAFLHAFAFNSSPVLDSRNGECFGGFPWCTGVD